MPYLLGLLFFTWFSVQAAELKIPPLTAPVMDEAGFLSEGQREDLSRLAYEIYTHQGPQISILTVNDLDGHAIEDFSIRVAEQWKLGTKKGGNGLLIVISKAERAVRIEVGEGIEGEITDFQANKYIREILTPAFAEGEFHRGLRLVLQDIAQRFSVSTENTARPIVSRRPAARGGISHVLLFAGLILLVVIQVLVRNPFARGVVSGGGFVGLGLVMAPALGAGILILGVVGFFLGIIGISNVLFALMSGGGGRGGGFGGGGGGGWSGGGGGFSGGGSSGRW